MCSDVPLQQRWPIKALFAKITIQHVFGCLRRSWFIFLHLGQRQIQRTVHSPHDWSFATTANSLNIIRFVTGGVMNTFSTCVHLIRGAVRPFEGIVQNAAAATRLACKIVVAMSVQFPSPLIWNRGKYYVGGTLLWIV